MHEVLVPGSFLRLRMAFTHAACTKRVRGACTLACGAVTTSFFTRVWAAINISLTGSRHPSCMLFTGCACVLADRPDCARHLFLPLPQHCILACTISGPASLVLPHPQRLYLVARLPCPATSTAAECRLSFCMPTFRCVWIRVYVLVLFCVAMGCPLDCPHVSSLHRLQCFQHFCSAPACCKPVLSNKRAWA